MPGLFFKAHLSVTTSALLGLLRHWFSVVVRITARPIYIAILIALAASAAAECIFLRE